MEPANSDNPELFVFLAGLNDDKEDILLANEQVKFPIFSGWVRR